MSWDALDPELRRVALEVCTRDEIDVLRLYAHGQGYRMIGRSLGIDRDTARNRFVRASRKIRERMEDTA